MRKPIKMNTKIRFFFTKSIVLKNIIICNIIVPVTLNKWAKKTCVWVFWIATLQQTHNNIIIYRLSYSHYADLSRCDYIIPTVIDGGNSLTRIYPTRPTTSWLYTKVLLRTRKPSLLSAVNFKVPTRPTRHKTLFHIPIGSINYYTMTQLTD